MLKKDLILNVCVCKEVDLNIGLFDENLKVFILENFLNNYEICVGEIVWVRKMNFVLFERIVIGILLEERFLWVNKFLVLCFCDSILDGFVILCENDVFYFYED